MLIDELTQQGTVQKLLGGEAWSEKGLPLVIYFFFLLKRELVEHLQNINCYNQL